jgi:hypothetical protein
LGFLSVQQSNYCATARNNLGGASVRIELRGFRFYCTATLFMRVDLICAAAITTPSLSLCP